MQRLRSPFRLRPGPGAGERKGKGRKEEQAPADADSARTRRTGGSDPAAGPGAPRGPEVRHKITGASLRKRRAEEESHREPGEHPAEPPTGS
jgi:hypothetical protein